MKASIRLKLIAYTFLIVLIVGGSISLFFIQEGRKGILNSYEKKCLQFTDLISQTIVNDLYFLDVSAIRIHLDDTRINPDVNYTYVMDLDGKVLSDGTLKNSLADKILPDLFSKNILKANSWIYEINENILKIGGPVRSSDQNIMGYLQIGFTLERSYQIIQQTTRMNILITGICFAIGAILAFIMSATFTKPIKNILIATQKIKKGDLHTRILFKRNDELGMLANSVNQMVEELEKKTEELKRSNKELEQFAYIASHDLQEPLYIVTGFTDILKEKYALNLDPEGILSLDRIHNAANRMGNLIRNLLQFARVNMKKEPFEAVDLNSVIQELLAELELKIKETHAQVKVEKLPIIQGDKFQISELFQNLICNALKFLKKDTPPEITIKAVYSDPGFVKIFVQDNGVGFEQEFANKIFEPFQRLHTQDEYEGSGLGLAICEKIVSRHGGKIEVEGTLNKGATFILIFPFQKNS